MSDDGWRQFKVITDGNPNQVWASGFYGEEGRLKAETMVASAYWHRLMEPGDKAKNVRLVVVPVTP